MKTSASYHAAEPQTGPALYQHPTHNAIALQSKPGREAVVIHDGRLVENMGRLITIPDLVNWTRITSPVTITFTP